MSSVVSDYRHPAVEAIDAMNVALDGFGEAALWSMPMRDLAALVVSVEKVARRVAAVQVAVLGQADGALVRTLVGAKSTQVWLHTAADVPAWVGRARLGLHHQLTQRPVTAAAFTAGQISQDAAAAVCDAVTALPASVPAALTGQVESLLVGVGRDEGTRAVVRRAMAITQQFAPEVLDDAERWAREHRFLALTTRHDGTVAVRGLLDKETGALALAVLGPLAAPAPAVDGTPRIPAKPVLATPTRSRSCANPRRRRCLMCAGSDRPLWSPSAWRRCKPVRPPAGRGCSTPGFRSRSKRPANCCVTRM
jgi:Domain of unknown function (DUF222)